MSGKAAFLGLGAMGFGMATTLVKKGFHVNGFDLYGPTLERFTAAGGHASSTPKDSVQDAQYVVFMVATAAQILSALFDGENAAVHNLSQGAVVVLSSTGPPEHVPIVRKLLDDKYSRRDILLVDAPVSGGTIRAANGTLTILASGPEKDIAAARPVLDAMAGDNLHIIPGGLGAGTNVKMVHQVLAGIHIATASEVMGFAAVLGLNTKQAFEALKKSRGTSWMFENRVPHMLVEDKMVYSALNIIVKDIGIVTAGGRSAEFPLFLSSATEQVLATGVSAGLGPIDDAALVGVYLPQSPTEVLKLASSPSNLSADEPKLLLVEKIMAGVHLAAAAEAMSLGRKVGLEPKKLFEIISGAAGSSAMFVEGTMQLLSGVWKEGRSVDDVIAELTEALEEAHKIRYPLHLTGTALQIFELAKLKGFGKEPAIAVSRVWDSVEGPYFPRAQV
ncbi:related to 3-hydroxyisobutyrate dehydrogenase, mitochondrial precursor [Rhynchosporium secalis]|uniref:Related to 3-hydroxyisobutyrate dehydrogenase, mitochondrial n=1 Tax=Rhynchosporium secalis TaxID=38038 RepID=A0A1E1M9Z8_RHYSE|nr:related to 3-hydroxyisobutyrate dehydrogenase, mitochondrial precursor [Rhynchosporium secalis]